MSNLGNVLEALREEHKEAAHHVAKLDAVISAIEGIVGHNGSAVSNSGARSGTMSAAGRARIAAAQRARWAKHKKESQPGIGASLNRVKRTMSASARRKIAAAQRARWAKLKKAS